MTRTMFNPNDLQEALDWAKDAAPHLVVALLERELQRQERIQPFPETWLHRGQTLWISAFPQCLFRPTALYFDPACAPRLNVLDIKVGVTTQSIDITPIPATAFNEDIEMRFDCAEVGNRIAVLVEATTCVNVRMWMRGMTPR